MTANLPRENFPAGSLVFRAGSPGDCAYAIDEGNVEVLGNDGERIALLGFGSLFGEVALLDCQPRTATVRALTDCTLVRIEREHIDELLRHTDPVIRHLLTLLLERFRSARPQPGVRPIAHLVPEMQGEPTDQESALRTLVLTRDLSHALASSQLELFYQPLIAFSDRALIGFEALVRWRHPTLGLIFPDEFISLAERTGLVHRLGHWVLQRAVRDWTTLRTYCQPSGGLPPFVSINLSAAELSEASIVPVIRQALQDAGMDPHELKVELTETVVIEDKAAVSGVLEALADIGIAIALDDFGTGYGGLDYLKSLPISCLKIDKSFVQEMGTSLRSHEIVQNSINLAWSLGLTTIAEGIEDEVTADRLQELGCGVAQGYFFARPMPLPQVGEWLASRQAGHAGEKKAPEAP
jgi:diguanylate cyclase